MKLLLGLLPVALLAQDGVIRTSANEVGVDVVVRDKRGRLMRGLPQGAFSIVEDGVVQKVTSFGESTGSTAAIDTAGVSGGPVRIDRPLRLITLVFERLGPDGRRLSKIAALDLLKGPLPPNHYYAVFTVDQRLQVLQPFTADRAKLVAAVERATNGTSSDFGNDNYGLARAASSTGGSEGTAAAATAAGGGPPAIDAGAMANEAMGRMINDMLMFSEVSSREQQGRSSVFSLWGIVKEQYRFPGRKAVLYFCEGLHMPNSLVEQFKSMLSDANRANVAVYPIDARGLRSSSDQGAASDMLARSAATNYGTWKKSGTGDSSVSREEIMNFDRTLDSLRANVQQMLVELAESTGGFLIANTNDFRQPLRRLAEDIDSHYMLYYRPSNDLLDGRFREIVVKVDRPGVTLQSRAGYYAVPSIEGQQVMPFEVPLLNALAVSPVPKGVEFRAAVIPFEPRAGKRRAMLIVDVPLSDVTFTRDDVNSGYRTHLSTLSLVKDTGGRVVAKLSRDVPVEEPLDKLDAFRQGRFILTRTLALAPGRYTVETAVADREGKRIAAKKSAILIAGTATGPSLSGLVLVRRIDKPAESPDPDDPFQLPIGRIVPTLVDKLSAGKGAMLSVFFNATAASGVEGRPTLTLELSKDGEVIAKLAPELPSADAQGRIPYLANIPIESATPGRYEFRATVDHGGAAVQKALSVTIE